MNRDIPEIDIDIKTFTISSHMTKVRLTRRNVFFKGIYGRLKCLYHWVSFCTEKKYVDLDEWLDETIAYSIEPDFSLHSHDYDVEIERALEKYLTEGLSCRNPDIKS